MPAMGALAHVSVEPQGGLLLRDPFMVRDSLSFERRALVFAHWTQRHTCVMISTPSPSCCDKESKVDCAASLAKLPPICKEVMTSRICKKTAEPS